MKHTINYETKLVFDLEGNKFEMSLEQIPGKEISPEYILNEFSNKLKEFNIDFEEDTLPLLIAKNLKTNILTYKYDGEPFFTMNNEISENKMENIVTYEGEKRVLKGQDQQSIIKETDMIVECFKKKLEEKLGNEVSKEEVVQFMANGATWEE